MKTNVQTPGQRSVIGRTCLIRDKKHNDRAFFGARVIEADAEERCSRRVRLLTGEHAGEVLRRGEYDVLEFTD